MNRGIDMFSKFILRDLLKQIEEENNKDNIDIDEEDNKNNTDVDDDIVANDISILYSE